MNPIRLAALVCLLAAIGCSSQTPKEGVTVAPALTASLGRTAEGASAERLTLGTGYGQVTMDNKTSATLDLYVDGAYGCRALKGFFCTTHVKAGTHALVARASDGRSTSTSVTLNSGDSVTWTIGEQ